MATKLYAALEPIKKCVCAFSNCTYYNFHIGAESAVKSLTPRVVGVSSDDESDADDE